MSLNFSTQLFSLPGKFILQRLDFLKNTLFLPENDSKFGSKVTLLTITTHLLSNPRPHNFTSISIFWPANFHPFFSISGAAGESKWASSGCCTRAERVAPGGNPCDQNVSPLWLHRVSWLHLCDPRTVHLSTGASGTLLCVLFLRN